jgi:phosphoglycerol transferase MdoB-like AlkP superfamily enzyme
MQVKMMQDLYKKFDAYEKAYSEDYFIKLYNASSSDIMKSERRNYLAKAIDTEEMVAILVNQLYEEDKLKDTILAFVSDHQSYSSNYVLKMKREYLQEKLCDNYQEVEMHTVPAFIYSSKIKNSDLVESGYSRKLTHMTTGFDIAPTLLTLLGVEYNQDIYLGYAVINEDLETHELLYKSVSESVTNGYYFNDDYMGILGSNLDYSKLGESEAYVDNVHEQINNYIIHKMYVKHNL